MVRVRKREGDRQFFVCLFGWFLSKSEEERGRQTKLVRKKEGERW